ncbi:major facilitator superfamily MFS_1 [Candidatus Moduliflexus flocculans]|uniref:Major facilitator superfamily MFS_1 n=1 Tax=Candidatus Moduliflexus flocculans TaxID=1499966 RepID=A0A0S6VRN3_9BACT|nr:major facilitator superfamily MFS_1 [Candidatus Moduliflexus flocculans]
MGTIVQLCLGTVYAWSFFQNPIVKAYGWTNAQTAWTFSIAIFMLGISAAWGGIHLPKFGPKTLAMSGGILYAIAHFISAYALSISNLPLLYVGYGVIGGIGLGLGYVTPVATASKWFPDKQGFVTGMVVMGFGFGSLVMSKILGPFFMEMTGNNLVFVFAYIGVAIFICLTIAGAFLQMPPAGYAPVGYTSPATRVAATDAEEPLTAKQCIISPKFAMMWLMFFFNIVAGIMFIAFQSPLLQDLLKLRIDAGTDLSAPEISASLASAGATLIAISSLCNGIGRFFWGGMSDKIGRVQTFRLILGTQFAVFLLLLVVTHPWLFGMLVCYVLLCYGGGFGTMPSFVKDTFGVKFMPVVYGAILTAWGCAGVVGPQIVAGMKDRFAAEAGTYSFAAGAACLFAGFLIALFLKNEHVR